MNSVADNELLRKDVRKCLLLKTARKENNGVVGMLLKNVFLVGHRKSFSIKL
jgi:hypothetical protein